MDTLIHYGTKRHSGRWPWGSGERPFQSMDLLAKVNSLKKKGLSEKEIATMMGRSINDLRSDISTANYHVKFYHDKEISAGKAKGLSNTAIAKELGISEATVRNYLKSDKPKVREQQIEGTKKALEEAVAKNKYLDIGAGVERQAGVSREKLRAVTKDLVENHGYHIHEVYVRNMSNPDNFIIMKVLTKEPDIMKVREDKHMIRTLEAWSDDGGRTFQNIKPPKPVSSKKVMINYKETGGEDKDGVIELRRGVKDLDLGSNHYAQVRIAVDGTHYLKGMAVYADDLPKGVDIRFNTNKSKDVPKMDVLKKLKDNDDNPFGATIKRQKGALNIVNDEGDWDKWKSMLSSQFLSKQPTTLIKDRIQATIKEEIAEFESIKKITNPVVKKYYLEEYADSMDKKARHLKAAGFPNTKAHVILPIPDIKPNEVYAPNYKNGDKLVLVRYPHGGIFELADVTVNNNAKSAKKLMGNAKDGIGLHPSVARKLSGADFDGDTVYAIPNNHGKIKTLPALKELANFDPHQYAVGKATISGTQKQREMGIVSNLITDMTLHNAPMSEIARAVRQSMVVIDSEKHKLDWKQSAIDNGISALYSKYQRHFDYVEGKQKYRGASTIISRSKNDMDKVDDAHLLTSHTNNPKEKLYADYANKLKSLKKEAVALNESIPNPKRSPEAAKIYAKEVMTLDKKLNDALLYAPRERQAQIIANATYWRNKTDDMSKEEKKRLRQQSLAGALYMVKDGDKQAKKQLIQITDNEWEAIQNGAISTNKLKQIMRYSDPDRLRSLATPSERKALPATSISRAKALLERGRTYSEVADALGVSVSTLKRYAVKEADDDGED